MKREISRRNKNSVVNFQKELKNIKGYMKKIKLNGKTGFRKREHFKRFNIKKDYF